MPKPKASRKAQFRAALALAGLTQESWAVREGITPQWLSVVLNEKEESGALNEKIDAFTAEQMARHRALAS